MRDAPFLKELTVDTSKLHPLASPHFQLTRLRATAIAIDDVINLLVHVPNLHTLYLADINTPTMSPKPILLEELNIAHRIQLTLPPRFFATTPRAPRLIHLHIEGCARIPLETQDIYAFIQQHGLLLQTLVLGGFWEPWASPLLLHTPHLRELRLCRDGIRDDSLFQQRLAQSLATLSSLQCFSIVGIIGPFFTSWMLSRSDGWSTIFRMGHRAGFKPLHFHPKSARIAGRKL